MRAKKANNTIQ